MTTNTEQEVCGCCDDDDYHQLCTCICDCIDCCEEGRAINLGTEFTDVVKKVQILVDILDEKGILEDNTFTFPDGEVWYSTYKAD